MLLITFMLTRCKVEFRGITAEAERDIFRRVQLGVTLTSAGK